MKTRSKYMRHLPSIYVEGEKDEEVPFIESYLSIFEAILTGVEDSELKGKYLFSWEDVPGNDSGKLIDFLRQNYDIDWVKTAKIEKTDDGKTIGISTEKNSLSLRLINEKNLVHLIIDNGRTDEFIAMMNGQIKNDKLNVYKEKKSLGETLDIISDIFYPRFSFLQTGDETEFLPGIDYTKREVFNSYFSVDMDEFLTWMAGWISLVLKEDWDLEKKREVLTRIIPIYKIRGTKEGLERYLQIYAGKTSVYEFLEPFQVGVTSTVGMDSIVGEGRPYYFQVNMTLPIPDIDMLEKKEQEIRDVIEMEKPVHTDYDLIIQVPTLEIGTHSTVGVDTLLGGLITRQK